jgi:hypothetical protein
LVLSLFYCVLSDEALRALAGAAMIGLSTPGH